MEESILRLLIIIVATFISTGISIYILGLDQSEKKYIKVLTEQFINKTFTTRN